TRILHLLPRPGDSAPMALMQLVDGPAAAAVEEPSAEEAGAKKKRAPAKAKAKAKGQEASAANAAPKKKKSAAVAWPGPVSRVSPAAGSTGARFRFWRE